MTNVFADDYFLNIIKYEGGASKMLTGLLTTWDFSQELSQNRWVRALGAAETTDQIAEASKQGVLWCCGGDRGSGLNAQAKYCFDSCSILRGVTQSHCLKEE